jgi:predicted nucleic acid-binding protein
LKNAAAIDDLLSIYADTSFFVSLYLTDRFTAEVERRLRSRPSLWMTPLHVAEWTHAVEQHVFRKIISRSEADLLMQRFQQHRAQNVWRETPVPDSTFEDCAALAGRHAARLGVRTLDTLHVAAAAKLKADLFWTFDIRQVKLAVAVGLRTGPG